MTARESPEPGQFDTDSLPKLTASPARRIAVRASAALWLGLWAGLWLLLLSATSLSPPVDNAEQLSWVRSLEWGYYKHPPLPTFLLWPWVKLFGLQAWVPAVVGALVTCAAILVSRRLVCELANRHVANLATLGTLCIGYYNGRLDYFNHDVVLLLAVAAAAWFCWQAFAQRSRGAWLALGFIIGLGALAKYQVVLAALSVAVYWAWQGGWRDPLHRRGLLQAAAIALLVLSPHAVWMVEHGFQPVHYAIVNSAAARMSFVQCSVDALRWIGDQFSQLLPALLLGAGLLLHSRRKESATAAAPPSARDVSVFLFCFGLLPLALMAAVGLLFSVRLHMNWATAFMPLTCAWLMQLTGWQRWNQVRWQHALLGFAAVQLLLAGSEWATSAQGVTAIHQHKSRNFESQQLADELALPARAALGGPIRIIAGPQRLASVLALRLAERPLVLVDGNYEISPWIPEDLSDRCGVLWVGGNKDPVPHDVDLHPFGKDMWWGVELGIAAPGVCSLASD